MNKKAQFEMIWWIAYLPLTTAVILALVLIPSRMLDAAVQPYYLDAEIMEERIYNNLDYYDPALGTQKGTLTTNTDDFCKNNTIQMSMSQKAFAAKANINGKDCYANKAFYKDAKPLTPVKYNLISSSRTYQTDKGPITVNVEQIYPSKYEKIT